MTTQTTSRALARPGEFLTFRLGAEEYGIDILRVQEIRGHETPTRIAGAPAFILGVVNLRGVIVPIVDLRLKFGLDQAVFDGNTVVIILNVSSRVVGVVVDSVSDVLAFDAEQIRPAPEFSALVGSSHVLGLGTVQARAGQADRMLILTDIERLMAGADMGLFDSQCRTVQ